LLAQFIEVSSRGLGVQHVGAEVDPVGPERSFVASFVVSEPAEYGEFDKAQNKARDKDMLA
jgi:hypothetical protein